MLEYGFSAKKSSGFGIVKDGFQEEGVFRMKGFEEKKFKNFSQLKEKVEDTVKKLRQESGEKKSKTGD
jgi:hypothetical protein